MICEDLARLEPVSELIRGIGPTLLLAILLDGPQLPERWPGRYANVMADDPGCSVLTVSALGSTTRSQPSDGREPRRTIALWKDPATRWHPIDMDEGKQGVVLTVAASWKAELTADGRNDGTNAAMFVLQGTHQVEGHTHDQPVENGRDYQVSAHVDFQEITLFTFLVDVLLDAGTAPEVIDALQTLLITQDTHHVFATIIPGSQYWEHVITTIQEHIQAMERHSHERFPPFVAWVCAVIKAIPRAARTAATPHHEDLIYFGRIVQDLTYVLEHVADASFPQNLQEQEEMPHLTPAIAVLLEQADTQAHRIRVCVYGCLAILWAIHLRLSRLRRHGRLNHHGTDLLVQIEQLLQQPHDDRWYAAMQRHGEMTVE